MTVLFLSDLWPPFPGGAERLQFNLARDLYRRGHDVTVLTGYAPALQFDGPPLTIREDIGVFQNRDAGAEIVKAHLELVAPKVVVTTHLYAGQFSPELIAYGAPLVHLILNGGRIPEAFLAVYISEWIREKAGDAKPGDMLITPPVFDDVVADVHGDAVGFIKPIEHKGIDMLYRVAERLPRQRFVVLRGEWRDIEIIRDDLPNVEYMEPVDDMRDFYEECRMVLMPSRSEDAGTVAQECALNGIPCVSSNVDGLAETNRGGVCLDRDDLEGFVRWVLRLGDTPALVRKIVARQLAGLETTDQQARLDEFAGRIGFFDPIEPPSLEALRLAGGPVKLDPPAEFDIPSEV